MLRIPLVLTCAALLTAADTAPLGLNPAALMGGGNFTNGAVDATLDTQLTIVQTLGVTRCRINLYPDSYIQRRNWDLPQENPIDAVMLRLHAAGVRPMLLLEYYSQYLKDHKLGTYEQWKKIGVTLATRYRPGGTWAKENNITDGFGIELYTAFNEPEPTAFALGGELGPIPYIESLRGFADGVHSVEKSLQVAPGGFMAANAWKDYTLRGIGPFLAPLLNDGTLAGIDLHTYYDVRWAPMEGGYASSSQSNFSLVKKICGIERDVPFFCTEFNYKNRDVPIEKAAAGLFTGIWDNLGIVGNDGLSLRSELALPWNIFHEQKTDGEFGLSFTNSPYVPLPSGEVIKRTLELTKNTRLVAADPQRTGMMVLRGSERTIWVWQNRTGWTDKPGTSVELSGVPAQLRELEIHGWNGVLRKAAIQVAKDGTVTVDGLPEQQTLMFVGLAPSTGDARLQLPPRAAKPITQQQVVDGSVMTAPAGTVTVLAEQLFEEGAGAGWSAAGRFSVGPAQPRVGTCAEMVFSFDKQAAGSSSAMSCSAVLAKAKPVADGGAVYLNFHVRGNAGRRPLRIKINDAGNETFITNTVKAIPAWREVWVKLDGEWSGNWGGTHNKILDWPLQGLSIEAMNWEGGSPASGEHIWIDDVRVVQIKP